MQKHTKKHNISRKILSALITSAISAATLNPLAFALPVQEGYKTDGVNIATSANNLQMDISGAADNNVINWSKFNIAKNEDIAKNEKVIFDEKNYLNLINDTKMSEIWGTLKGGGSIYLINPNGILFGEGAIVDVGTLYASTREISGDLKTQFENKGTIPTLTNASATGDIINMGTLTAAKNITLEGNNIVIEGNDSGISDITAKNGDIHFVVNAGGSVQVGAVSGNDKTGYTIKTGEHQSGTIDNITYFKLVRTLDELQAINDDVSNNYMLAGNIDGSTSENFTPIGTEENQFAGRFNGLNYSINDLVIYKPEDDHIGLFGSVGNGGIIEYVKRNGGSTTGACFVGGIVGFNNGGTIRNVYNNSAVTSDSGAGGIVGYMEAGSIENAINAGNISNKDGYLGGIVGYIEGSGITVQNVINKGSVTSTPDDNDAENTGGVIGYVFLCDNSANTFENLKNEGTVSSAQGESINVGGVFGSLSSYADAQNTVKNIKNEANVSGTNYVGGIVGKLAYTTIENVKNEVTVTVDGRESVGQIVGYNDNGSIDEGEYKDSWKAELTSTETPYSPEKYIPLYTTPSSGGGSSSGGSTTPTSTDTDTSSGDDSSTDTDTTPTIPTTPTTPTVPLTPTTPTTPTAPTTPTSETTTPVEETTPQTPTVEPTVEPTSAETEPVAPIIEPKTEPVSPTVTQTATTTLEKVLQSVGKKQEGGNNPAENITMKTLTEAENAAAANAQTATNSPAINSAAQIPQTSTDTVTTTTTISTSSDSSTTSTPSKQSAPSVSTTSTRNTSSASSDNNASANATIITDDKLSIVINQGGNMPASMSVDAIAAQENKSANADNTADTTQSVETSQNDEDKKEK